MSHMQQSKYKRGGKKDGNAGGNGAQVEQPLAAGASSSSTGLVSLHTNYTNIQTVDKEVFRYDVGIEVHFTNGGVKCLTGEKMSEYQRHINAPLCIQLLRTAIAGISVDIGLVHDGNAQAFFSNQLIIPISKTGFTEFIVHKSELPPNLELPFKDIKEFKVTLAPNAEQTSFNMNDYKNRDATTETFKKIENFLSLITSQDGRNMGWAIFKNGVVVDMNSPPSKQYKGQEVRDGVDKGIRTVQQENASNGMAIIMDNKQNTFFVKQDICRTLYDILGNVRNVEDINWKECKDKKSWEIRDKTWISINDYLKDMRVRLDGRSGSLICAGITNQPIGCFDYQKVDNKKDLNLNLPALIVKYIKTSEESDKKEYMTEYWAMENTMVVANQKVPMNKLHEKPRPIRPDVRFNKIREISKALQLTPKSHNKILEQFGITLSDGDIMVKGKKVEKPMVSYQGGKVVKIDDIKSNWSFKFCKALRGAIINQIYLIYTDHEDQAAIDVVEMLRSKSKEFGVQVDKITKDHIERNGDISQGVMKYFKWLEPRVRNNTQVLVFCIDKKASDSHGTLKLMEAYHGIATQQITLETAQSLKFDTSMNIIKKMNVKMGGINYDVALGGAIKSLIDNNELLIISYDVNHPGQVNRSEPIMVASVVGFAFNGATDKNGFVGDYHYQNPTQERVDSSILKRRTRWVMEQFLKKSNGNYPKKIMIIRDGVSEGQYKMVLEKELVAIKEACNEMMNERKVKNWSPKYAMVIATKRHSARFFEETNGKMENMTPSTVVDDTIIRKGVNEFFLLSAKAIQGTAKSTYYQLLNGNEFGFESMREVQTTMLALCYQHQIGESPISIPEPVKLADEWAKRGSNNWTTHKKIGGEVPMQQDEKGMNVANFEKMTEMLSYWKSTKYTSATRLNA